MTWKKCLCCSSKTSDSGVAVSCHVEETFFQADTLKQTKDDTHNQSAEVVRRETIGRLTGKESNEYQDLNDKQNCTNTNNQNQQYNASGLSENIHSEERNIRCNERKNRSKSVQDVNVRRNVHDEKLQDDDGSENCNIFLEYLLAEIKIRRSVTEVDTIREAVEHLISFLLVKLEEYEPALKSSKLVGTGSCYDGTKIFQPDEFDFLAVVDCLSLNNLRAEVSTESCSAGGYAHAVCEERSHEWSRVIEQDGDNCVIACMKSKSLRTVFRECFHFVLFNEINKELSVEMPTGMLKLEGFSVPLNGPQCNVKALWKSIHSSNGLPVDIDISPAIKCEFKRALTISDVINDDIFKLMSKEQYVYLIPRPKMTCRKCFKMVFPQSDQQLVMELSESHKKVLLVLKYISHEVLKFNFQLKTVFNSFTMKNALLQHSFECKEEQDQTVAVCLIMTLNYMRHKLDRQSPELISVFTISRNVWKNARANEIVLARTVLRNVIGLFNEINCGKIKDLDFHELKRELLLACSNSISLRTASKCLSEKQC